jgi:hypothetical protein
MKRFRKPVIVFLLGAVSLSALAQEFEISPYTGWMLGGRLNTYNGSANVKDGQNYGIAISYEMAYLTKVEFMYNRMVSELEIREYANEPYIPFKLANDYFQIGVVRELMDDVVRPFGVGMLGAAIFTPQDSQYSAQWRFSASLAGGIKIFPTEHIGIRLQARMLIPMYFGGLGFWCGTGGCSGGLSASSAMVQGDFTGALIFAF